VTPGGIGTVLELMLNWQLLQVKHVHDAPLILVGNMWAELADGAKKNLLKPELRLASPQDMDSPLRPNGRRGNRPGRRLYVRCL
jgi:predicted Rossmann-fold nucleotide-binding protein